MFLNCRVCLPVHNVLGLCHASTHLSTSPSLSSTWHLALNASPSASCTPSHAEHACRYLLGTVGICDGRARWASLSMLRNR